MDKDHQFKEYYYVTCIIGRAGAAYEKSADNHELVKTNEVFADIWQSKREQYVQCQIKIDGQRNRSLVCITLCSKCNVYLHSECFVQYHVDRGIAINPNETDFLSPKPSSVSSSTRKRSRDSDIKL